MNTNIKENLEALNKAVREGYKRDMKEYEWELHSELNAEFWFLENTGFSRQEIETACLMKMNRETIERFLEYMQ